MKLIKVPWLFGQGAITISPYVLILNKYALREDILAHEQVHLNQVQQMGWFTFYWNYITNSAFRKSVEAEGYAEQRRVYGNLYQTRT